jgi:hypothetical protein
MFLVLTDAKMRTDIEATGGRSTTPYRQRERVNGPPTGELDNIDPLDGYGGDADAVPP